MLSSLRLLVSIVSVPPVAFCLIAAVTCSILFFINGVQNKDIDWKTILLPWKIIALIFAMFFIPFFLCFMYG